MNDKIPKLLLILIFVIFLNSCASVSDIGNKDSEIQVINTEEYKVRSSNFSKYRVNENYQPPKSKLVIRGGQKQAIIEFEDTWYVSHVINSHLIIQSKNYNDKQCRLIAKKHGYAFINIFGNCSSTYDFGIAINTHGEITLGWILLPGKRQAPWESYLRMPKTPIYDQVWIGKKIFQPIKK